MKRIKIIKLKKTPKKIKKKTYKDILSSKEEIKNMLSKKIIRKYEKNNSDFPFIKSSNIDIPNNFDINSIKKNNKLNHTKIVAPLIKQEITNILETPIKQESNAILESSIKPESTKILGSSIKQIFPPNSVNKPKELNKNNVRRKIKSKLKNKNVNMNNRTKKTKPITFYFPHFRKSLVNTKKDLIMKLRKLIRDNEHNKIHTFIKKMNRGNLIFVLNFLKITNKNTKAPKKILDNILFNILTSNLKIKFS